jgi:hypothetical protein
MHPRRIRPDRGRTARMGGGRWRGRPWRSDPGRLRCRTGGCGRADVLGRRAQVEGRVAAAGVALPRRGPRVRIGREGVRRSGPRTPVDAGRHGPRIGPGPTLTGPGPLARHRPTIGHGPPTRRLPPVRQPAPVRQPVTLRNAVLLGPAAVIAGPGRAVHPGRHGCGTIDPRPPSGCGAGSGHGCTTGLRPARIDRHRRRRPRPSVNRWAPLVGRFYPPGAGGSLDRRLLGTFPRRIVPLVHEPDRWLIVGSGDRGVLAGRFTHDLAASDVTGIALAGQRLPLPGGLVDPGRLVIPRIVADRRSPAVHRAYQPFMRPTGRSSGTHVGPAVGSAPSRLVPLRRKICGGRPETQVESPGSTAGGSRGD